MDSNSENLDDKEKADVIKPRAGESFEEFLKRVLERFEESDNPISTPPIRSIQDSGSPNRKSHVVGLLIIIAISIGFGIYIYLRYQKNTKIKQEAGKQAISNMVTKYNAVTDWINNLDDLEDPYSFDVEKILIREDKRPLLLSVSVKDVITKDGKFYVTLEEAENSDFRFTLECNSSQTEKFRDRDTDEFAVIASINSVAKSQSSETESESSNTFVANGQCLDLLPVNY